MLARPTFLGPERFDRGAVLAAAASASLAVAAGAHFAAFFAHRSEGIPVGGFFIAVGGMQLAAALLPRSPRVRVGIVAGNLTLLLLWAVSRTVGLPFGSHAGTAEAFGVLDVTAAIAQVAAVAAVLLLPRRLHRRSGAAPGLCIVAATGAVALAGALLIPVSHGTEHHRAATAPHSHGAAPLTTPGPSGGPNPGAALHSGDQPHAHP